MKTKRAPRTATLTFTKGYNGDGAFKGMNIKEHGPVGFYGSGSAERQGILFKDSLGNITYFDVAYGVIYPFDDKVMAEWWFVFQPDMNSLRVTAKK